MAQQPWMLVAALAVAFGASASPASASLPGPLAAPSASDVLGGLTLGFEPNRGQFAESVRYLGRGLGYELTLSDAGATLVLTARSGERESLGVRVVGSVSRAPHGVKQLPGVSNYLVGSDRKRWTTGVESYAKVVYSEVLPGIDWVLYGKSQRELEYDLVFAPGTDVASVSLAFDGARRLSVDARGSLRLELGSGRAVEQSPPVAYQLDARGRKTLVAARYLPHADGTLGFRVGTYDHRLPLVIDPAVTYATYFGGSGFEVGAAVAMDSAGRVYVAGSTAPGLFPVNNGVQQVYGGGGTDAFVCKLNPGGTALVYSTFIGGSDADAAAGVAVDLTGNAYVVGNTLSTDFPTAGPLQAAKGGSLDGFITKISPDGGALVYSTYLGGTSDDFATAVSVTASGSARLTGTTFSTNFPTVLPAQTALGGDGDAFVSFLNPAGSALTFSTYWGGLASDTGTGIALEASGAAHVVGSTGSTNFPLSGGFQATNGGGVFDAFVAKFGESGAVGFSSYLGGGGRDEAAAVAVDLTGATIVTGFTASDNFPVAGFGFQKTRGGGEDGFVSRVDAAGAALTFSTFLGGSSNDRAQGVAATPAGVVFVVGFTGSTNFPTLVPSQPSKSGGNDAFFTELSSIGELSRSSYYGGASNDRALALAIDPTNALAMVGITSSVDFPTQAALYPTRVGSQDAFIVKVPGTLGAPAGGVGYWVALAVALALALALRVTSQRARKSTDPNVIY